MTVDVISFLHDCEHCAMSGVPSRRWARCLKLFFALEPLESIAIAILGPHPIAFVAFDKSKRFRTGSINLFMWCYWSVFAQWMLLIQFWKGGLTSMNRQRHYTCIMESSLHLIFSNVYVSYSRLAMYAPLIGTLRLMSMQNDRTEFDSHAV